MADDLVLNLSSLVNREESESSLVRFDDTTDASAPRLNYAVPLPGAYQGRFYIETDFGDLDWLPAASRFGTPTKGGGVDPRAVLDLDIAALEQSDDDGTDDVINWLEGIAIAVEPPLADRRTNTLAAPGDRTETPRGTEFGVTPDRSDQLGDPDVAAQPAQILVRKQGRIFARYSDDYEVPWDEIRQKAMESQSLVVYQGFGGATRHTYAPFAIDNMDANPRFVVIEHYRLSTHFGDYGAGRTVNTFSLIPGEETKLYLRSWRRTEERRKEASSIFDSYTEEAASDFEESMEDETTDKTGSSKTREWHVNGKSHVNFGFGKTNGGVSVEAGGGGGSQEARESVAKSVSKAASHHSSKASSKRETNVSTELESTEASEFERIVERTIKNTNLSRTLNVVTRELNQEFSTYFSLVDVTVAFANDRHVFDEVRLHELDDLLRRYLPPPPSNPGEAAVVPGGNTISDYSRVKIGLIDQMQRVFDYQGNEKQFIEEVEGLGGRRYYRVVRASDPDDPNPHYPAGAVPVEGVVMDVSTHTVRTDSVIIDCLLGHGVALDNYALGLQQEALRKEQLENRKTELALSLIESGELDRLEAFRSLFGSVDNTLLRDIVNGGGQADG